MQVTQTLSEGLKQEFKVVLPASDLAAKLDTQLAEVRAKAQIKGFRPGKAPIAHLKKLYGKNIMGEVLQEAVNEANRKIVEEHKLRIALEPRLDFPGGQAEVEKALEAEGDFSYHVAFETLPEIEIEAEGWLAGLLAFTGDRRFQAVATPANAFSAPGPYCIAKTPGGRPFETRANPSAIWTPTRS